ncbi:ABC transporter ATP-binding protein [Nodosilinea sp. FACHB-131]|uniref:heterocyst formation ABC transporter subunit HepA n=1 Tax=Cyanophyceae TaxID=3028117 RepID=UPI001687264E|nr:heterocyst formation ABC transporter subunit HepA [Nodosilinea sp. FACHB-131]MBD1872388.1 ABC transporter ATP-binding protein [Nodosilinea sp. FACHB-131]
MFLKIFNPVQYLFKQSVKSTGFWSDNALVLRELKPLRNTVVAAIVFSVLGAFAEGGTVGIIASFLQGLTNPGEPPLQTGWAWFDVTVLATQAAPAARIYRLSALILVLIWGRAAFSYLALIMSRSVTFNLVENLRLRIFDQLQRVQLSYYTETRGSDLVSSVVADVNNVQQVFGVLTTFLTQGTTLLAYLAAMVLLSWQLTVISILLFGLMSLGISSMTRRVREISFEVPKANKQMTGVLLSFINGIRTVHASGTQEYEQQRFVEATEKVRKANLNLEGLAALVNPLVQAAAATILILMVAITFNFLIVSGQMQASTVLTFLFALTRLTPFVSSLNSSKTKLSSLQGAMHSVNDLLREDNKPYLQDGTVIFSKLQRSIDLVGVDFGYKPNEPVLHDITLSIKQGETTALVGSSGAGKTTLADLIPRFYDPNRGKVLVDGVDLRNLRINSFRQHMAIVSQDTFIFHDTVRANIAYGTTDVTDSAIVEAARQANALEFILALPEQFETVLGDRGVRLSGGQRQRIAIARALLRNPDILILDEATSALDSVTEQLIQESLEQLSKGRTVIAIAHRLSTISSADKVVVLDKGRVVEQGSYQELLYQQGALWKYHQMQFEMASS